MSYLLSSFLLIQPRARLRNKVLISKEKDKHHELYNEYFSLDYFRMYTWSQLSKYHDMSKYLFYEYQWLMKKTL